MALVATERALRVDGGALIVVGSTAKRRSPAMVGAAHGGRLVRVHAPRVPGALPSGAFLPALHGKVGRVRGESSTYNSSLLVEIEGHVYDIHDSFLVPA